MPTGARRQMGKGSPLCCQGGTGRDCHRACALANNKAHLCKRFVGTASCEPALVPTSQTTLKGRGRGLCSSASLALVVVKIICIFTKWKPIANGRMISGCHMDTWIWSNLVTWILSVPLYIKILNYNYLPASSWNKLRSLSKGSMRTLHDSNPCLWNQRRYDTHIISVMFQEAQHVRKEHALKLLIKGWW